MAWSPEPFAFEAIGTHWIISLPDGLSASMRQNIERLVHERIALFDKNYSRFRPDSLISEMSQRAGNYFLPSDAKPMFDLYEKLYRLSHGAVTPLIGQVLSDAGYDAIYSLETKKLSQPPAWDEVLEYAYPNLLVKRPVLLDFGAGGKGYLIDIVANILGAAGLESFIINAGGDIIHRDQSGLSFAVGLENPDNTQEAVGIASLANRSLCGSAGNRRVWGQFHHIISPFTLSSPRHIKALWTMADSTLLADMMATALFFMEPSELESFSFEYIIIREDNRVEKSAAFPANLFV